MTTKTFTFFVALIFCSSYQCIAQTMNLAEKSNKLSIPVDSLKVVLEEMYDKDQGIRKDLTNAMKTDPQAMGQIIEKMNRTDSLNQVQMSIILERYGWVERSKIGKKASHAIFYVVQHSSLEMMEKYFPQLQDLAARGEAKKTDAAMMEDRILMYKNEKQIYGTQASNLVRGDGVTVIWPIAEPLGVNVRRKQIGFESTIEKYAESMGASYDPHEELPSVNPW